MKAPPPGMEDAVHLHQSGRLAEAERAYRAILAVHPDYADALHLLGALALQTGRLDEARTLIGRALERAPGHPLYLGNLATAHLESGDTATAVALYRRALEAAPDHDEARFNLGNALRQSGDMGGAAEAYRVVAARHPDHLPARNAFAICLAETGRLDEAIASLIATLDVAPDWPPTRHNLARLLQQAGRIDEALVQYDEAIRRQPGDAMTLNARGTALLAIGLIADAERDFRAALAIDPRHVDALVNLGTLHQGAERLAEAEVAYRQALAVDPDSASAHMNLGSALSAMGRHDEALAAIDRSLAVRPNHADSWHNRGQALKRAGRVEAAIEAYDTALALAPDHVEARFGRAVALLLLGRFAAGWRDYMARRAVRETAARFHRERLPSDLAGRHVVVERDQGLGDELVFLRFLPALASRGARVTYLTDPRLVAMLSRAAIADRVLAQHADPGPHDLRLAVGDLPCLLGVADAPPPPSIAIAAIDTRAAELARRLAAFAAPPYLAVTWRAGSRGDIESFFKQAPIDGIAQAIRASNATLVAVQRLPEAGEVEAFTRAAGRPVLDLTALNDDLEAMLALMGLVDDYVCVSNTNVHLRSARGCASRVLVPTPPEFRWMARGDESPWFRGTRVYRQDIYGGWQAALDALARDLRGGQQG